MQHVVLEIEEGSAALTVAEADRRSLHVRSCARASLPDVRRGTVLTALRVLLSAAGTPVERIHVVLGERRMQHFVAEVPKLGPDEIRDLVARESRRIGSLPSEVELLGHCWPLPRHRGKPPRAAAVCVARNAWQPIESALEELRIPIASLTSMEHAIAGAIPPTMPARTAVLEISAGKARFILCERDTVLQSRRFMLPSGVDSDGDSSMIQVQLAMEVPRTLDYLAEQGHGRPDGLLVSHRVFRNDEDTQMLRQEVAECRRYVPRARLADGVEVPGLATFGVLERLTSPRRTPLHTLTAGISVTVRRSPARIAAALLAILVGSVGGIAGFQKLDAREDLHAVHELARVERQRLEAELASERTRTEHALPLSPDQARLLGILNERRPLSLLISEIANATVDGIVLDAIEFGRGDRITLSGQARGASRVVALDRFSGYLESLEDIALVASDGRESIQRSEDDARRIAFTVNLFWRTP
ncbi:MAG: hypothetical protein KDB80_10635 [Planctomycetes bacterium]|nr:hypothetical protein [Planctomycetota bacterium]